MVSDQVRESALSIAFGSLLDFGIFVAVFYGLSQLPVFAVDIGAFLDQYGGPFVAALVLMQTIDVALQFMRAR